MTNLNENIVPIMIAFIFAIIIFAKLFDYYGYHQYHFNVEYKEKIITRFDIYSVNERNASGFVYLKRADFIKGQPHIINLIHQGILEKCGNCTIKSLQIKSITRLD